MAKSSDMTLFTEYPISLALACSALTALACGIYHNSVVRRNSLISIEALQAAEKKAYLRGQQEGWHQKEKKNETLARY